MGMGVGVVEAEGTNLAVAVPGGQLGWWLFTPASISATASSQHHQTHHPPLPPHPAGSPDPQLDAVLLHVLSHCAKAADRIKKNNERLRAAGGGDAPALDAVPKDQGFTRAKVGGWTVGVIGRGWCSHCPGRRATGALPSSEHKHMVHRLLQRKQKLHLPPLLLPPTPAYPPASPQVLVLLPQRNLALRLVTRLLALAVKETRTDTIQNKQRFLEEFGDAGG